MKTNPKHPLVVAALIVAWAHPGGRLAARPLTTCTISTRPRSLPWANQNGAWPNRAVLPVDNLLYGTTAIGGLTAAGSSTPAADALALPNSTRSTMPTRSSRSTQAGCFPANNLVCTAPMLRGTGLRSVFSINKQGGAFQILPPSRVKLIESLYTPTGPCPPGSCSWPETLLTEPPPTAVP